ncbi:unnamed protein product [[Actinomadura] parvosata subsp. kistnae]|uniref:Uncharacterized protein n=1 Tax=[Actinomadura] parvosata subsp. kistnae TaxID=1909395 RepID=A0A1U9ZXG8_9ACTN|nr:hypothetical protein [Nonomuraea sp. ATCC 55076]AQZ62651.1 hypothetical protein BKM31_15340 [Nonomuraea sp. ATCC 55076]SPL88946.1 unnamed protein product [Actinomadura parvosata subsp. kistnae]
MSKLGGSADVLQTTGILDLTRALERARVHAGILVEDLERCRELAYSLEAVILLDRARGRALRLAGTLEEARIPDLTSTPLNVLDRSLDQARLLSRGITDERIIAGARHRVRALTVMNACDRIFEPARTLAGTLDEVQIRARELDRDLGQAVRLVRRLDKWLHQFEPAHVAAKRANVARPAVVLVDALTRLLPARHRSRYAEELHAELYELANAKATSSAQVIYSVHQLRRVLELRMALSGRVRLYHVRRAASWVLASEWRTWTLLGPFMVAAAYNVYWVQGWGSAFYSIPCMVGFYAGVEWLRKRWHVTVKRRRRPPRI